MATEPSAVAMGMELVFPTRYVRVRRCLGWAVHWLAVNRPKQVDRRWGATTFLFDRMDDAGLALARRAARRRLTGEDTDGDPR